MSRSQTHPSPLLVAGRCRAVSLAVLAWAALTALAGCASVAPPSQVTATQHAQAPSLAAAEAGLRTGTPAASWWQAFADPQLDALVLQAMARNLDVRAQIASVKAARALLSERRFDGTPSGGV